MLGSTKKYATIAFYTSAGVALLSTTILLCGCLPAYAGNASLLSNVHAVRLQVIDDGTHSILISSFAVCENIKGNIHCSATSGMTTAQLSNVLHSQHERPLDIALQLQRKVFYGSVIAAAIPLALALPCAAFPGAPVLQCLACGLALLATASTLVDAFSAKLAFSALEIASRADASAGVSVYMYEAGGIWMGLQWLAFALSMVATVALGLRTFVDRETDDSATPPPPPEQDVVGA